MHDPSNVHTDAFATESALSGLRRLSIELADADYLDAHALIDDVRQQVQRLGIETIDVDHPDAMHPSTATLWIEHEVLAREADVVYAVVQATLLEQVDPYRPLLRPIVATTWRSRWELLVARPEDFASEISASVRARVLEFLDALKLANPPPSGSRAADPRA
jgi:hypothetical protein